MRLLLIRVPEGSDSPSLYEVLPGVVGHVEAPQMRSGERRLVMPVVAGALRGRTGEVLHADPGPTYWVTVEHMVRVGDANQSALDGTTSLYVEHLPKLGKVSVQGDRGEYVQLDVDRFELRMVQAESPERRLCSAEAIDCFLPQLANLGPSSMREWGVMYDERTRQLAVPDLVHVRAEAESVRRQLLGSVVRMPTFWYLLVLRAASEYRFLPLRGSETEYSSHVFHDLSRKVVSVRCPLLSELEVEVETLDISFCGTSVPGPTMEETRLPFPLGRRRYLWE